LTRYRLDGRDCLTGVGVMIESPRTELRIRPAAAFQSPDSPRIDAFAREWCHQRGVALPACRMELLQSPPAHSGFGSGTQLAQAVASGLARYCGGDRENSVEQVRRDAALLDRGCRSMIGSYGFATGGMVVDGIDADGQRVLAKQVGLPAAWRVVTFLPRDGRKKFGLREQLAFDNIAAEQVRRSRRLEDLVTRSIVPAAESGDFEQFADSVYDYGRLSGEYYTDVQGGIYNGPVITALVGKLLHRNCRGLGQSSWGPVVFAWCRSPQDARSLTHWASAEFGERVRIDASPVRNRPAVVREKPVTAPQTSA
jgi:beta-RFAP synthase